MNYVIEALLSKHLSFELQNSKIHVFSQNLKSSREESPRISKTEETASRRIVQLKFVVMYDMNVFLHAFDFRRATHFESHHEVWHHTWEACFTKNYVIETLLAKHLSFELQKSKTHVL